MKQIILAFLLFTLPLPVFALSYSDCDDKTAKCICAPEHDDSLDQSQINSTENCRTTCQEIADDYWIFKNNIDSYSVQCNVDGRLTTIAQGDINVLEIDYNECDAGTAECLCEPNSPSVQLDQKSASSILECQTRCSEMQSMTRGTDYEIEGYSVQCDIGGESLTISEGNLTDSPTNTDLTGGSTIKSTDPSEDIIPKLNIEIPGLDFKDEGTQSNILGSYIQAIYNWLLISASLLAIVMLMIGGLQYMLARGNDSSITSAKKRIFNAITGIILLFSAYSIAFIIDPATTIFDSLNVTYINSQKYIDNSGDVAGSVSFSNISKPAEVLCGSEYTISEIVYSMVGNVAYRMGGKGGPAPYKWDTHTDPRGVKYSTYCPDNNICLDCSGFASYVTQCSGSSIPGSIGGTAGIFTATSEKMTSCDGNGSINGETLNAGDLIGWSTTVATEQSYGHIFIYIGDGKIADSAGSGREAGTAVSVKSLTWACKSYEDHLYVIRQEKE